MGRTSCCWRAVLIALALGQFGLGQEPELEAPPAEVGGDADENVDILARGPVHEAFAEQVSPDPQPGVVAPKAPPDPIDEVPPDWKPEGDDVMWIPGYWFWDEDRGDHVWVSGVWRRVPPDRRWVPGYWQATGSGFQWVAGFWGPAAVAELEYSEVPPESLEAGPSSPAPSDDVFWIPGNWVSSAREYRWRPGYWHPYREDWAWVSARYVWTPRGCIFIPGYWDYTLARRGFLFAPVYFRTPVYLHAGFHYRPTCWIGSDALLMHLFVLPQYNHLFFGDYYAPVYRQRHYIPCYDYHMRHRGFASLYVYYEHRYHQRGIDYCQRVRDWHNHYASHADMRPAHTFRLQGDPGGAPHGQRRVSTNVVVRPYRPERSGGMDRMGGQHLEPVASLERDLLRRESSQSRDLSIERRRFEVERKTPPVDDAGRGTNPIARHGKFVLPESPGGRHRERTLVTLPDASSSRHVPSASDAPDTIRKSGNVSQVPRAGDKNGERRVGEIRRDRLTEDPAPRVNNSEQQHRGAAQSRGLPNGSATTPENRVPRRMPLANGTAPDNSLPNAGSGQSDQRRLTVPELGLGSRTGRASGVPPADVTTRRSTVDSGARANRSVFDATPHDRGLPTVRGQAPSTRVQAPRHPHCGRNRHGRPPPLSASCHRRRPTGGVVVERRWARGRRSRHRRARRSEVTAPPPRAARR